MSGNNCLFHNVTTITELIQRIMPLPEEIKAYKEYAKNGKDFEKLTEEDR